MGLVGNHDRTCMSKLTYFLFLTQHEPSATLGFECEMCLMGLMCLNMCFRLGVLFLRVFCVTLGQGLGGSPRSLGMSLGYKTCPHFLPEPLLPGPLRIRRPLMTPLTHFIMLYTYWDGLHPLNHKPDKSFLPTLFLLVSLPIWRAIHIYMHRHTCCGILF